MALDVKHLKISAVADGVDTDKVQPSDWNDSHDLSGFGGAAELNVGTVAGTVAAGDHVHNADEIVVVPSGSLISTDVQAALEELNSDLDAAVMTTSIGKHTIWVPAGTMTARTTNGAASGSVETTTNKVMLKTLDFDASTIEYAQFAVRMPKGWNLGTVTAAFAWSHAATTTNFGVSWGIQAVALSNDDAQDAAFGTAIYANDTGGTTDDIYISPTTADVTIGGTPAAEDYVVFQVLRKADDGTNDTLAVDARLHGVTLYYTTSASTDD